MQQAYQQYLCMSLFSVYRAVASVGTIAYFEPGSAHCTAHLNATFKLLLRQHPSQIQKSICTTAGFRNQFKP